MQPDREPVPWVGGWLVSQKADRFCTQEWGHCASHILIRVRPAFVLLCNHSKLPDILLGLTCGLSSIPFESISTIRETVYAALGHDASECSPKGSTYKSQKVEGRGSFGLRN